MLLTIASTTRSGEVIFAVGLAVLFLADDVTVSIICPGFRTLVPRSPKDAYTQSFLGPRPALSRVAAMINATFGRLPTRQIQSAMAPKRHPSIRWAAPSP